MLQSPFEFATRKSRFEFVVSWNRICPDSRKIRKSELWLVFTSANSGVDEDTVSLPVIDVLPLERSMETVSVLSDDRGFNQGQRGFGQDWMLLLEKMC